MEVGRENLHLGTLHILKVLTLLMVRKAEKFTPVEQTLPLRTGPNTLIFFCTHHPSLVYTSAQ
jgi:hypothetical protein